MPGMPVHLVVLLVLCVIDQGVRHNERGLADTSFMFGVIMKNCAKRSFK